MSTFTSDTIVQNYLVLATMLWFVVMYVVVAFWHPPHYTVQGFRRQRPAERPVEPGPYPR